MTHNPLSRLEDRIRQLEARNRRQRWLAAGLVILTLALVPIGWARSQEPAEASGASGPGNEAAAIDEIRVRRLVLVDDENRPRLVLEQDRNTERRSRASGLTVYDATGAERGGFVTMEDGSVVLAMDAPAGVGAPVRDRIGLTVHADGSSYILLTDNQTRGIVRLSSDGTGGGGLDLFDWDMETGEVRVKTRNFDGEAVVKSRFRE